MEVIVFLTGIIILGVFTFILIEYPYYIVSLFVFLHLYDFNWELPGPLDLRGLISVFLFLRLVVFDKNNSDLIKEILVQQKFFILIILFSTYLAFVDLFNNVSLFVIVKFLILNIVTLLIAFLTIMNGKGIKTIVVAILITGIFATADLIYSYFVLGFLRVRRIIEHVILGQTLTTMDHNTFGKLIGYAFITAFLLIITKNLKKSFGYILIIIFGLGILISTSRGTILSVLLTIIVILLTQKALEINLRKLFFSALAGLMIFFIVALSYSFILKAMNISSEFSEQIYWRLVEEPLSIFNSDAQEFGWDDNKVQGTMRWRYYKYLRDINVFFSQNTTRVLFGFGTGGYKNIGELNFRDRFVRQYSSHNFYINLISEYGIVGLILFIVFYIWLLASALHKAKQGKIQFSFVYILIAMFFSTFGGDPKLTDKVSYILYGAVIAELILLSRLSTYKNKIVETSHIQLAQNFQRT